MTDVRVVLVTAPDEAVAERIARALVEARLAACVNLVPDVRSIYRWKDELCDDRETMMVIKTRAGSVDEVVDRVSSLHPYEVAEVLALAVESGSAAYLGWVRDETAEAGEQP